MHSEISAVMSHRLGTHTPLICSKNKCTPIEPRMITNQFYRLLTRETAVNLPFPRKIDSTMGFQSTFAPSLTLPDRSTPLESDSESITSTIPTKNQLKRSKNAQVRLVNNNDEYHLVSSSSNTLMRLVADFE